MTARIIIKSERRKAIQNRHPWLFSGAVGKLQGKPVNGDAVEVCDSESSALAWGFYNDRSDIRVRMIEFGNSAPEDWTTVIQARIQKATALRKDLLKEPDAALRLINADGDGISGLIVDLYAGHVVIQPLALWAALRMDALIDQIKEALSGVYEIKSVRLRVELDAARREGIELAEGPYPATSQAPDSVQVSLRGLPMWVDLAGGQKTGLFLDQAENQILAASLAKNCDVLNLFSYNGGFSLRAAKVAASVTSVDSSQPACDMLVRNAELSGVNPGEIICGDMRNELPKLVEAGRRFGLVIADPPPFARRRDHVKNAARAYQDLNRRSMALIDDGFLMTFSCSPFMDATLFRQIVFSAAAQSGKAVQVLRILGPGMDHPVSIYHPEGDYLTGLLLRVTG
jgi:23S rRNA (cytosine1962-C5)-methyltransferase